MIRSDQELAAKRERVANLERIVGALRLSARPEEWPALSSGYRLQIERMQGEILDYLLRPTVAEPAEHWPDRNAQWQGSGTGGVSDDPASARDLGIRASA